MTITEVHHFNATFASQYVIKSLRTGDSHLTDFSAFHYALQFEVNKHA